MIMKEQLLRLKHIVDDHLVADKRTHIEAEQIIIDLIKQAEKLNSKEE